MLARNFTPAVASGHQKVTRILEIAHAPLYTSFVGASQLFLLEWLVS